MSQWVNNYAIWQDLPVTQGRGAPVRVYGVMVGDERPPALHINEGAEEPIFRNYVSGGDTTAKPDVSVIQHMLEMVHIEKPQPRPDVANINGSVLNPNCPEFVPKYGAKPNFNPEKYFHDRKDRNVALRSLLEADSEKYKMPNITLIKPDDIIQNNVVFERQRSPYYHLVSTPPNDMYKKESPVPKITILDPAEEPNNNSVNLYPPSEYSKEFYNKSTEETKLNTYVKNDIWAKAGKKAKEVEKRKQQSAQLCNDWGLKEHNEHLNLVRLPCHRHVIFEECIVCEVVKKHCCDLKMYVAFPKSM